MKLRYSDYRENVVLLACGSFSPVTLMHLRMMEMAREHTEDRYHVAGGFLSPVHDNYKKDGLVEARHRIAMLRLALEESDWLDVWTWETDRIGWTPTALVIANLEEIVGCRVVLVAGTDLLSSFGVAGLWTEDHLVYILKRGLCLITREPFTDPDGLILQNDTVFKHRGCISVVPQYVPNGLSSTLVRLLVKRGMSVEYLVPSAVSGYIRENHLYQ